MGFIKQSLVMKSLIDIKKEYEEAIINKWQYIDEMYTIHSMLFDYAEFLCDTNISSIKICDDQVIMKFRNSGIKFICSKNDKRLAPFDTLNFGEYEQEELNLQLLLIDSNATVLA